MSVVMVVFGGWELTTKALAALREHTEIPFELVVVDNPSTRTPPGASFTCEERHSCGTGRTSVSDLRPTRCRPGRGRYLFLNADTVVQPGWLRRSSRQSSRTPPQGRRFP